jgi:hypothetical protein
VEVAVIFGHHHIEKLLYIDCPLAVFQSDDPLDRRGKTLSDVAVLLTLLQLSSLSAKAIAADQEISIQRLSSRDFPAENAVGRRCFAIAKQLGKYIEKYGQAARTISIGQLNILLYLHFQPINQVVSLDPLAGLCLRDVSS